MDQPYAAVRHALSEPHLLRIESLYGTVRLYVPRHLLNN